MTWANVPRPRPSVEVLEEIGLAIATKTFPGAFEDKEGRGGRESLFFDRRSFDPVDVPLFEGQRVDSCTLCVTPFVWCPITERVTVRLSGR